MDSGHPFSYSTPPSAPLSSPSPPLLIQPPPEDAHQDEPIFDLDRPASRASTSSLSNKWNDADEVFPSSARGRLFLTPDYKPYSPPRTASRSRMADSALVDGNGCALALPMAISGVGSSALPGSSPFNYQTQFMSTSPEKSKVGQRRGHRYKHSSISTQHQIFLGPPPRPPPVLPASLPVPNVKEAWTSMQKEQRARLCWCLCHGLVAGYVFFSAGGSLALTALSHLVFFDVGSAAICVGVDVLGNFEVWRRSSVRHPFGLQRAEVLAGFAMSIFLVFGGFDLLSHNFKHALEEFGSHEPHHSHAGHGHATNAGEVDVACLAAALSTIVSAYGLKNHARIRRVMRPFSAASLLSLFLPEIFANPFHSLTLFFSFLMLLLPLLSITSLAWFDGLICVAIAVSMFLLGTRLAIAQGLMLLMSYGNGGASQGDKSGASTSTLGDRPCKTHDVVREIESEPAVARVEEAQFWQVHYGLCMATLKLCVNRGCDDASMSQLRQRVGRIVQNRLGEGYGKGGALKWEVTLQMSIEPA